MSYEYGIYVNSEQLQSEITSTRLISVCDFKCFFITAEAITVDEKSAIEARIGMTLSEKQVD